MYFASIREELGLEREQLPWDDSLEDVAALIRWLSRTRGERWDDVLHQENLLIAVNQSMVKPPHPLKSGDEVAFFPPVHGG